MMKVIGHRGARGLAPENTLKSIGKALRHHVDEVEFDVRVTKDGIPVLHHNANTSAAGQELKIADHTLEELHQRAPNLASLHGALSLIDGRAVAYVEVKGGEPVEPIVTVLKEWLETGMYTSTNLLLGSKSQKTLRELHQALPEIEKIVIEPWSGIRARYRARQVAATRLSMRSWWLWRGFLKAMHDRGYRISPYTMNDPVKVRRWQPYIYGIITDYPDRFKS